MASIIRGYEYDIFISYRHNDNKYDGWVTAFVNSLIGELESTFKEEISVYFDESPHDRLMETYNVSKSLEIKLRSFIFIPVISQTYCDPKSFAWQHELLAYNKMARDDQFGRDIKLRNGNVASRILPVRIRDLDPEDVSLFEKETGNVMRSVDFVFKTASGVNRPLRVNEDHPADNMYKTYYHDQVNKVANAIYEIFRSVRQISGESIVEKPSIVEEKLAESEPDSNEIIAGKRSKSLILIMVAILFCISGMLVVFKFRSHAKLLSTNAEPEKSIAILPFRNDSPNDTNTYFINGLMEDILNRLQIIKDLRVISRTSVEQYRNSTKSIPQIAKEQNVNYIVEGSGQKYGNSFTVNVQLIRAVKEDNIWAKSYQQEVKGISDIINVQKKIAQSIVEELKATITPQEKKLIEKVHTKNLDAYDFFQRGREELLKFWVDNDNYTALSSADKLFRKAINFDSTFADAYAAQALVFYNKNFWNNLGSNIYLDSVLILANRALFYDDQLSEAYFARGIYYDAKGMKDNALEAYDRTIDLNPNDWKAHYGKANHYATDDQVKYLDNLQKALLVNQSGLLSSTLLRNLGGKLEVCGFKDKALVYYRKAFDLDGDSAFYLSCLGGAESDMGNYSKSIEYFKRAYNNRPNYSSVILRLGEDYQRLGDYKESLRYFKEYNILVPDYNERVAYSYWQNGLKKEATHFLDQQLEFSKNALKTNAHAYWFCYNLACIYSFRGDTKNAFKYLNLYVENKNCEIWMLTNLKNDPLLNGIRNDPEFGRIVKEVELNYEAVHKRVGNWLKEQHEL